SPKTGTHIRLPRDLFVCAECAAMTRIRKKAAVRKDAASRPSLSADENLFYHHPRVSSLRSDWNGFEDKFWNLGQLLLWVATRNRTHVDRSSDDNGGVLGPSETARDSELYGLAAASAVIDEEKVPVENLKVALAEIHRQGRDGVLNATAEDRLVSPN